MTRIAPVVTLSPRDDDAVLFDLDGVLTRTASVHAAAWKRLFDGFLKQRAAATGDAFVPFDIDADSRRYVDGRRTTLEERCLVSMGDMHLGALELALTAENWSASVTVHSAIDGRVVNGGAQLYRMSDIQQGTTSEGVHLGAMAGTVDLVQRVSTGIEVTGDVLRLNPKLPQEMERLDRRIRYRGHSLDLRLTRDTLTVREREHGAAPIQLGIQDEV